MTARFNQDFITFQGDDVAPIFTVRNSSGVAIDISTVSEITWGARLEGDDANLLTLTKTGGQITFVTDGSNGQFQVSISSTNTSSLDGMYLHYASIADASGNVTTVAVGRMRVGLKPIWTYNPAKISSSQLFQVRRLIGDVINNDQQMTDEEINFFISQRASIYGAAADCCRSLAAQYSRKVDVTSPGEIRTAYGQQAKKYLDMANTLEQQSRDRGAGVMPYAGGISVADRASNIADTDRVQPSFNIGLMDNLLPVPSVGNEVFANPNAGGNGEAQP